MKHAKDNPYEGASSTSRRSTVAIVLLIAALVAGCAYVGVRQRDANARSKATTHQEQYMPGQPLDAIKLSAPSWSDMNYMYRIGDRTSGACWYRVHVDGRWEIYLICEGRSYVDQQLKERSGEVSKP